MAHTDRLLAERALANVHFTAKSVAANAGRDLEQYFDLVEDAARQPDLVRALREAQQSIAFHALTTQLSEPALSLTEDSRAEALRKEMASNSLRNQIQSWLEVFGSPLPVFASFVLYADGLQIARQPLEGGQTIGRSYAWRAYFTGHDRDEDRSWRPVRSGDYLKSTYLSPPFVSEFTDEWVVVISTPVRNPETGDLLGVMGVMVQLGAFAKLPGGASTAVTSREEGSFAVLIDTRPRQRGQILQHPFLNELDDRRPDSHTASIRRHMLDRSQGEEQLHVTVRTDALDKNYRDPFGHVNARYAQRWLASRNPVIVRSVDSGLAVIVQESYDQIIGQPLAAMRRGLVLLSLTTLVLSAAAIVPLWAVILRLVR
jgi:hypothetical protein